MALSMSSAGAGGGAGAGAGMSVAAMAHQPGAVAQRAAPQPKAHGHAPGHAPPPPPGILGGGDAIGDKRLARVARSTRHLPLVCVDLYGGGHVAYNPPGEDEDGNEVDVPSNHLIVTLGSRLGSDVVLKRNDDASYKSLRRLLGKGYGFANVLSSHPITSSSVDGGADATEQENVTVLHRPHSLLGSRRTDELHPSVRSCYVCDDDDEGATATGTSAAISEHGADGSSRPLLHNQALDGSSPNGDDFDRVSFQVPLHESKKPLTLLPEEAAGLLLAKAKQLVYSDLHSARSEQQQGGGGQRQQKGGKKKQKQHQHHQQQQPKNLPDFSEVDEDNYLCYPTAFAVPGYALTDATVEAFLELSGEGTSSEYLLFPRASCALACSFRSLPNVNPKGGGGGGGGNIIPSKALRAVTNEHNALLKEAQREERPAEGAHVDPLVIVASVNAEDGAYEVYAFQVCASTWAGDYYDTPYGGYRCLHADCGRVTTVAADGGSGGGSGGGGAGSNASSETAPELWEAAEGAIASVRRSLSQSLPGREACAIVLYGDVATQHQLEKVINRSWSKSSGEDDSGKPPPIAITREDACAVGAAMLAAAACGRGMDVARPVAVQKVATVALGIRIRYDGNVPDDDDEVKVVFDFDKRLPAGPYQLDLNAAECAFAHANGGRLPETEEEMKMFKGKKDIPAREEAAKALRVQIVQRSQRSDDAGWVNVGEVLKPLCMIRADRDDKEDDGKDDKDEEEEDVVGCESSVLEITMSAGGIIGTQLVGDGESVVQATKSARSSTIQFYGTIAFCVLFFGGFLAKSFNDDRILERDTKRLLEYYKHVIPGSMHDGDEHGARYLAYKYRNKKPKLWRRLEKKYGVPMPADFKWDDFEAAEKGEEELDLDKEEGDSDKEEKGESSDDEDEDDDSSDDDEEGEASTEKEL